MPTASTAAETLVSQTSNHASAITLAAAAVCAVWYFLVIVPVCTIGFIQLWRHYSKPRQGVVWGGAAPHITIIRPIQGLEPCLYECLASTFRQLYPPSRLHIRLCISSRNEPSLPVLQRLLEDFPDVDAQILVEEEDAALHDGRVELGPNPKIRNMSRAYREAAGNIIWIIDCNVWVARGTLGRMVQRLEGGGTRYKNKFVHHLPLVVDTVGSSVSSETHGLLNGHPSSSALIRTSSSTTHEPDTLSSDDRTYWTIGGGRLEELFMSSAHAKFYTAINTVAVAPCIVGKSTMFRRSHLDALTHGKGIDFFSENICEDHLIGDILWKQRLPEEKAGEKWGKHAVCFGDVAIQPMANMSLREYWSRRVRWLRVRKFTVTIATLVEPGTESYLASAYGAFATTTLPLFHNIFGIPQTWRAFMCIWLLSVVVWCMMDRVLYQKLHSAASIEVDENTPAFARAAKGGRRRNFSEWLLAWLGRESLAFPIWFWAFYGGTRVEWRGKKFWVGMDMKVHELRDEKTEVVSGEPAMNGARYGTKRKD